MTETRVSEGITSQNNNGNYSIEVDGQIFSSNASVTDHFLNGGYTFSIFDKEDLFNIHIEKEGEMVCVITKDFPGIYSMCYHHACYRLGRSPKKNKEANGIRIEFDPWRVSINGDHFFDQDMAVNYITQNFWIEGGIVAGEQGPVILRKRPYGRVFGKLDPEIKDHESLYYAVRSYFVGTNWESLGIAY